jgi:hypothetical protein
MRRILRAVSVPVVVMTGVVLMLAALQKQLIFFPARSNEAELLPRAAGLGLEPWRIDGERVGWRRGGTASGPRMLVFHGNAGQALDRVYYVPPLSAFDPPFEVLLFEYPGYGSRAGEPSAQNLKQAAESALDKLVAADRRPLYLLGESLGSGVACHLAGVAPERLAGLLLVTPFTSLEDVAAHHYPWLPVGHLLSERFDCAADLARFPGPVGFLLAGRDEVVPTALGQALYDGYAGRKWLHVQPLAGHNSLDLSPRAAWWRELEAFYRAAR